MVVVERDFFSEREAVELVEVGREGENVEKKHMRGSSREGKRPEQRVRREEGGGIH